MRYYNESMSLVVLLILMLTYCLLEIKVHRHMHMIELGLLNICTSNEVHGNFKCPKPKSYIYKYIQNFFFIENN
jgi:hypothetical protein